MSSLELSCGHQGGKQFIAACRLLDPKCARLQGPAHCCLHGTSAQAVWGSGNGLYTSYYPLKTPRACFPLPYHIIQSTVAASIVHAAAEAQLTQHHAGMVDSGALSIFNNAVGMGLAPSERESNLAQSRH